MSLCVEKHQNAYWLVVRNDVAAEHPILLARFVCFEAAEAWKTAHNRALCFAREVGRSGIG